MADPSSIESPTGRLVKRRARRLEDGRSVRQFAKWLGAANSFGLTGQAREQLEEDLAHRRLRRRVEVLLKEAADRERRRGRDVRAVGRGMSRQHKATVEDG